MFLSPGQVLNNRYRIVSLLSQGGFGSVYRAWDSNLNQPVALKESLHISLAIQKQFRLEAKLLFRLSHPNLPRVLNYFVDPGRGMYLIMDFIEGNDLGAMLELSNRPLIESQVLPWVLQICEALIYLHSHKPPIIHRDIKPANIRITLEGRAMLVDFGIAKLYDPGKVTTVGARAVTDGYSPPEQYGRGATDPRSDLYALGATLYHLLTGWQPINSVQRMIGDPLTPPEQLNPGLSKEITVVIKRAMELDARKRFQNATDFKKGLETSPYYRLKRSIEAETAYPMPHIQRRESSIFSTASNRLRDRFRTIGSLMLGVIVFLVVISCFFIWLKMKTSSPAAITGTSTVASIVTFPSLPTLKPSPSLIALNSIPSITPMKLVTEFIDEQGMRMKLIPAGKFVMGGNADVAFEECRKVCPGCTCNRADYEDMEPAHEIFLDAFYVDLHEVTNANYALCVKEGFCTEPSSKRSSTRLNYFGNPEFNDYPVIYVSWGQARDYCGWRGVRLPTEAEWEKAATGVDNFFYPWGNSFDGYRANFCDRSCSLSWMNKDYEDGFSDTAPVGSYSQGASSYGILDMAGNVWEWVWDWYSSEFYAISPLENPQGPETGQDHVGRGGSWYDGGDFLSVKVRGVLSSRRSNNNLGFRCSRSP